MIGKSLARSDWYYPNISLEMAATLDYIVQKQGRKYGIHDKGQLIRTVLGEFIARWEEHNNIIIARNAVRLDAKRDAMKPITRQP